MPETKTAVLYARYSPRPTKSESCEVQLERCRLYCAAHDLKIIGEYRDERLSGGTMNRPGLAAALELSCEKRAALVVFALARFARTTRDTILSVERLHQAHADFISVSESVDTTNAMGKFSFVLMAALAELERGQISERTSTAMRVHQSRGRRMGRFAPYGTMIDPADSKRLLPNAEEEQAVEHLMDLHGRGLNHTRIAAELNKAGVPYRDGRAWYREAVRRVLRRERTQPSRTVSAV